MGDPESSGYGISDNRALGRPLESDRNRTGAKGIVQTINPLRTAYSTISAVL
jgi:hypothetical protein